MIPLPFAVPVWLVVAGLILWLLGQVYSLLVTKPRQRRERQARKEEF